MHALKVEVVTINKEIDKGKDKIIMEIEMVKKSNKEVDKVTEEIYMAIEQDIDNHIPIVIIYLAIDKGIENFKVECRVTGMLINLVKIKMD